MKANSFSDSFAVLCLLGMACLAPLGEATTLGRMEFPELVRAASAIARVRCHENRPAWHGHEIWTETRCEVLEGFKGALPKELLLVHPGGRVGQLTARVDGAPQFLQGEELYAFLWRHDDGPYSLLGWTQGAFRIRRNQVTRGETVTQESAQAAAFATGTKESVQRGWSDVPIASFRSRLVREIARANGGR